MILLIDNYDSFVHNLARYLEELGQPTRVVRNDALTVPQIEAAGFDAIVISPGPCTPAETGVCRDVIRELGPRLPILGVCLGHQAIGDVFGAQITRAAEPMHGRTSLVRHGGTGVFESLPNPLPATRYHSLVIDPASVPDELLIDAATEDGTVMALHHRLHPIYGVQFHPESVLTPMGHQLLANFLRLARLDVAPLIPLDTAISEPPSDWYGRPVEPVLPLPAGRMSG